MSHFMPAAPPAAAFDRRLDHRRGRFCGQVTRPGVGDAEDEPARPRLRQPLSRPNRSRVAGLRTANAARKRSVRPIIVGSIDAYQSRN